MDTGFKNKVALVAASSEGLGKAAAEGFAREGAKLALCSRSAEKLNRTADELRGKYNADIFAQPVDVRDSAAVTAFVDAAHQRFGGLDAVVTNSGGPPAKPFLSLTDDEWRNGVDLCLMSHVFFTRAAIPHMQRQKSGAVVMITSLVVRQPDPALMLSSSIRAATLGLVRALANEFGKDGVRINAVGPGYTMTARQEELAHARAATSGKTPDEIKASWAQDVPLGRTAMPSEIGDAIVYLASDRASYITGQTLIVDGGKWKGV
ncbi:MAG: SDR family oxidoreductase [Acidobacteriales bacterium]|nr:SDR family oxidoreductase [Terriglobales bacterium]